MSSPGTAEGAAPPATHPSLWKHVDFRRLWAGQTISIFGSQFTLLALPLIAANVLQASPAQMGLLGAAEFSPFLLFGLFAGVWVDRLSRRLILIVGDVGRAVLLLTIPAASFAGALSMGQLYAVGFLIGVLTVFFDIAYQAYLPSLVSTAQLVEGNSKLEASRATAQVGGPGLAGLVIQRLSAPAAIIVDAFSFLISGLFLGAIRHREEGITISERRPLLVETREGLAVVFGNRLLWSIAGSTGTFNFFSSAVGALIILFATRDLLMTPATIGLTFSVAGGGALLGALVAAPLASALGVGRSIILGAVLGALWFLPVIIVTPATALPLLAAGGVVGGIGNVVYNVNQVSLRQAIVPRRLQGRLNATMRFLVWGTMPLGSLTGGVLGNLLGLRLAISVSALGTLLAVLWVLFSPVRTLKRIPEAVSV